MQTQKDILFCKAIKAQIYRNQQIETKPQNKGTDKFDMEKRSDILHNYC